MNLSLLDTDILSEFLRGNEKVIEKVDAHVSQFGFINLSTITYYEILNSLLYKEAKKQLTRFEDFIELNTVVPLTLVKAKIAAAIQSDLRKKGREIGHTETLITGTALSNQLQLVTNNTEHFKRIDGLEIGNWLK